MKYKIIAFFMLILPRLSAIILRAAISNRRVRHLLRRSRLIRRIGKAVLNRGPFLAQLNVTNACNQKCTMCNLWHNGREMPLNDVKAAIDIVEKMGAVLLTITGGEPTLHPKLAEIIRYSAAKEFLLNINTNGTMPDIYGKIPIHLLDIATISFHSLKDDVLRKITGTNSRVEDVVKTVKYFKANSDAHVVLKFVISKENVDEIDDVISFANELDVGIEPDLVMVGNSNRLVATSRQDLFPHPEKLITAFENIKKHKAKTGYSLISSGYYDFCLRSLQSGDLKWNCDAGLAYFSIYPNGQFGICKDVYTGIKITGGDFVHMWKNRKFRDDLLNLRRTCDGCNWSCYHTASSIFNNLNIIESL